MIQDKMRESKWNNEKMKRLKENGVTLVALAVTIIIMLILAGVVLNIAIGDNGLIGKAKQAVDKYEEAQQQEEEGLKDLDDNLRAQLKDAGEEADAPHNVNWDTSKVTPTSDGKGNVIPVPKGFYYAGGNKNTGFVISDVANDDLNNSKQGNQFVWIPCTADEYESAKNDVMDCNWSHDEDYEKNGNKSGTEEKGDGLAWRDNYIENDITNINAKYNNGGAESGISEITSKWENNQPTVATESISKYGGFYIARYEAGVPSNAEFSIKENDLTYKNVSKRGTTDKSGLDMVKNLSPVSKMGAQVWNFITQPDAKIVSENMYKNGSNGTSESVGSYLVDSQAWNHICHVFDNILGKSDEQRTITNSTKWGNYYNNTTTDYTKIKGLWACHKLDKTWEIAKTYETRTITEADRSNICHVELASGASDDFKVYNIYDMAGNVWEWTTSHNINGDTMYVNPRGGSFKYNGEDASVVHATGNDLIENNSVHVGFRVVLYIK